MAGALVKGQSFTFWVEFIKTVNDMVTAGLVSSNAVTVAVLITAAENERDTV